MRISFGSKFQNGFTEGSMMESIMDVLTGIYIGTIRAFQIVTTFLYTNTYRPIVYYYIVPTYQQFFTTTTTTTSTTMNTTTTTKSKPKIPLGHRPHITNGTIKVAAVGFGRTGTYSVLLALEELGYPTLHTIHLYSYENEEILHSINDDILQPAFRQVVAEQQSQQSEQQQQQQQQPLLGQMNFQLIANSGYEAIADLPFILYYQQIYEEYPDCKFILTTRSSSDTWYQSWESLTQSISYGMHIAGFVMPTIKIYSNYIRWMLSYVNHNTSYMTDVIPSDRNIRNNAIATYETHNTNVRNLIPSEQLLEFNVKEGWGPLCTFLEVPKERCPIHTPFPKSNSRKQIRAQSYSAVIVGAILLYMVMIVVRRLLVHRRQRRYHVENSSSSSSTSMKKNK